MNSKLNVFKGDITTLKVDAIVNAANSRLMGGGGVDGAIHRAGGPAILEECKKIVASKGGCPAGEAVITTGGNLPCRYVIHTVGPIYSGTSDDAQKLASCYKTSLRLAAENKCYSIAFPNISTGVYGYPKREAARVSVQAVKASVTQYKSIKNVIFCCFDDENYLFVNQEVQKLTSER